MTARHSFPASQGRVVVDALIQTIDEHGQLLSEIDGAIGDGDHGINMRKGFLIVRDELDGDVDLSVGLGLIGETLMTRIGGAMGPLYGSFFSEMGEACAGVEDIDAEVLGRMLDAGHAIIVDIGEARAGDKTLLDTLLPATAAFHASIDAGDQFSDALDALSAAAERGKESTREMVAKVGRASRLGERSRGVLDAGATSCWLMLSAMAGAMQALLAAEARGGGLCE